MAGVGSVSSLRRERRHDPLGRVEERREGAAHEDERRRALLDDDREEAHGTMRHVADAVAVEIVAAIVVPVVAGEPRRRRPAVGRDVEAVAGEIVARELAVDGARVEAQRPAVVDELDCRIATIRLAPSASRPVVLRAKTLRSSVASLISLSSRPYAAAPQLSSNRFAVIVTPFVYITATPEPLCRNVFATYSAPVRVHEVQPVAQIPLARCCR